MCNMDEGTSHHQELDCQSVVKKSGFEEKTDQNSDENDGSDINVTGVGFCEERQYFLEDEKGEYYHFHFCSPYALNLSNTLS